MKTTSAHPSGSGTSSAAASTIDVALFGFVARDLQHVLRRIDADDAGVKPLCQRPRKTTGAAADIDDQGNVPRRSRGNQLKPQPQHLWRIAACSVIGLGNRRAVVVHLSALPPVGGPQWRNGRAPNSDVNNPGEAQSLAATGHAARIPSRSAGGVVRQQRL